MAVRFDKKFVKEIRGVKAAFNRKITRLRKAGYTDLPERFTSETFKNIVLTSLNRKEIRRKLKDYESFIKKGGEKMIQIGNLRIPQYKYTNIKRYRHLLSYQTTKKLHKYERTHPVSNGRQEPFTFSQYGSSDYLTLKSKREKLLDDVDLSQMTLGELDWYLHKLTINTRDVDLDMWQRNYIDILQDTALSYGYDDEKLEVIVKALQKLSPEGFDELLFVNKNFREVLEKYTALIDIATAKDLDTNAVDVIKNLDSIYENLDELLADYA